MSTNCKATIGIIQDNNIIIIECNIYLWKIVTETCHANIVQSFLGKNYNNLDNVYGE